MKRGIKYVKSKFQIFVIITVNQRNGEKTEGQEKSYFLKIKQMSLCD